MSARPKNTIYVGGIPAECDESALLTVFEPFGEIMQVQLPKMGQSSTSHRGFGFVVFASDEEAESAIDNMHLNEIEGQIITVNLAKPLKNGTGDSRKPVWESEDWIKEYGGGGDQPGEPQAANHMETTALP